MVAVQSVTSRADLRRFVDYPYRKYAGDAAWVPPLRLKEYENFNPTKNPFFEYGKMILFLALQNGTVVGRVAAIDNPRHNDAHRENILFFGFFEAEAEEVAVALMSAVEQRAAEAGRTAVRGPANPTMDSGAGFQLDAYDTTPYLMMMQNPPSYPTYMEAIGYSKIKDLYAWRYDSLAGMGERLSRLAKRVTRRYDVTVRPGNLKHFDEELALLRRLYNQAWEKNWGFVKMSGAEFNRFARDLRLIIDPDIALFLVFRGEVVGLALGLPDINLVFKKMRGRLLPFGFLHLLNRRRIIDRARLPILGVLPEYRNRGFELVLIDEIAKRGSAKYHEAECSWILEDNDVMNKGIAATGATLYKTYRVYQKLL